MKPFLTTIFLLVFAFIAKSQVQFIWPLKVMPSYSEVPQYYSINNFVDLNPAAGITADWNCGTRTYDGHGGIDIDLWPFYWSMMDNNYVAVVAAAAGQVVVVSANQNNENNCGATGENTNGNYIAIRHADNSTSFYYHIRTNSAQVAVGDLVAAGDVIAYVGSSGFSSNPHLHFEVNSLPVNNAQAAGRIEPYVGLCNIIPPRWASQKPYWEPAIARVMTHGSRPLLAEYNGTTTCRNGEIKNAKAAFTSGDSIYFGIAMRDFLQGQSFLVSVYDPNDIPWFTTSATNNTGSDREKFYYTIDEKVPAAATPGTYRVVVYFNGTSATHFFSIDCPAVQSPAGPVSGHRGFKSSNILTSTNTMQPGNRLLLQAASKIILANGFKAKEGSILKARIRDCNYSE